MSLGYYNSSSLNDQSGMPQVGNSAFAGWEQKLYLIKTTQTMANGLRTESEEVTEFQGVIQPLSAKQLAVKPEGLRDYQWYQVHIRSSALNLDTDDILEIKEVRYKIMNKWSYERNSFIELHCVEDFTEND